MIFRNWVMQNFPFLEDDFDALTDYELFCKMMGYVKKFAEDNEDFRKQLAYYENYFNNLDLQEEVNKKLDEMALDGTLENLISQYIQLSTTYVYDTVEDMKEATNLVDGSYMRTSGFYSYNDGGGSLYHAREIINTDVIDEITLIALSDENLVAELIIENEMNVKQFGAKGDGETDDTDFIQSCLDNCKNIIINNGTYMIDSETSILPKSNTNIDIINATLKAITNDLSTYNIILLDNVSNVIIKGNGIIQGDKTTHTGVSGEHGHCVKITGNSNNIALKDLKIIDAWGDGVYIGQSSNILCDNLKIDNNSRNGISVTYTDNLKILNSLITGTNRTNPKAGIDIEPNNDETCSNILIDNCVIKNNSEKGIQFANSHYDTNPNAINNINITNCIIDNCKEGIRPEYTNKLIVSSNTIINNATCGIDMTKQDNTVIDNNVISNNGYAINFYICNKNLISNNICSNCSTTNPVFNIQASTCNIYTTFIIKYFVIIKFIIS